MRFFIFFGNIIEYKQRNKPYDSDADDFKIDYS